MIKKEYPTLFDDKSKCCGCGVCALVCPLSKKTKSAITMREDSEGFLYPILDKEKCIKCYRCIDVCPLKLEK